MNGQVSRGWLTSLGRWFRDWWIWILGISVGLWVALQMIVVWRIGSKPVLGTEGLISQMDMVIGSTQMILAFVVAIAAMNSTRHASRMAMLAIEQDTQTKIRERTHAIDAAIGFAYESAAYAGSLAELQRVGLKWYRRWLPDSRAQLEFSVSISRQLMESVAAAVKAADRLRYSFPDLAPQAVVLSEAVDECLRLSSRGEAEGLLSQAATIRDVAEELRGKAERPE